MVGASVLFGAKEAKAEPIPWNSVEDIVPQVVGESFNYTSSNSSVLANKIVGICYIVDPTIGNVAVGGFDLLNGVVTKSYFNQDWNSTTGYGLNTGDTANTDSNPGNSYLTFWEIFYDSNGDNVLGTHVNGNIYDASEQLLSSQYDVSGFTPFGTQPGTFTFTANLPEPSTGVLTALGLSALAFPNRTNVVRFRIAVSNLASFRLECRDSLTNAAWTSLGTFSATGAGHGGDGHQHRVCALLPGGEPVIRKPNAEH